MKINKANSLIVICDVQQRFFDIIYQIQSVIDNVAGLALASKQLQIPLLILEQNPRALGNTFEKINQEIVNSPYSTKISKESFSVWNKETEASFFMKHQERKNIILVGLETHICILKSFLDLKEKGYNVYVLTDCVSSSRVLERSTALTRINKLGGNLSTLESILFEMIDGAGDQDFKKISQIVKIKRQQMSHL